MSDDRRARAEGWRPAAARASPQMAWLKVLPCRSENLTQLLRIRDQHDQPRRALAARWEGETPSPQRAWLKPPLRPTVVRSPGAWPRNAPVLVGGRGPVAAES